LGLAAPSLPVPRKRDESEATPIALQRLCRLAHVSRAGYYRWQDAPPAVEPDLDLGDALPRIALESPSYGWPRIPAELKRRGGKANHKRVYRIMRQAGSLWGLFCLRRRKCVGTTNSHPNWLGYANLARGMVLTGIDQLGVADITYIRLETEFVYRAVVLDAFSRRVIGWALDRTLEAETHPGGAAHGLAASHSSAEPGASFSTAAFHPRPRITRIC
jgi:transposase InsO family protein